MNCQFWNLCSALDAVSKISVRVAALGYENAIADCGVSMAMHGIEYILHAGVAIILLCLTLCQVPCSAIVAGVSCLNPEGGANLTCPDGRVCLNNITSSDVVITLRPDEEPAVVGPGQSSSYVGCA